MSRSCGSHISVVAASAPRSLSLHLRLHYVSDVSLLMTMMPSSGEKMSVRIFITTVQFSLSLVAPGFGGFWGFRGFRGFGGFERLNEEPPYPPDRPGVWGVLGV